MDHIAGELAFLFPTEFLVRVLFLATTTKVIKKMSELYTEYPLLTIIARSE